MGARTKVKKSKLKNIGMMTIRNATKQEVNTVFFPNGAIIRPTLKVEGPLQVAGIVNATEVRINGKPIETVGKAAASLFLDLDSNVFSFDSASATAASPSAIVLTATQVSQSVTLPATAFSLAGSDGTNLTSHLGSDTVNASSTGNCVRSQTLTYDNSAMRTKFPLTATVTHEGITSSKKIVAVEGVTGPAGTPGTSPPPLTMLVSAEPNPILLSATSAGAVTLTAEDKQIIQTSVTGSQFRYASPGRSNIEDSSNRGQPILDDVFGITYSTATMAQTATIVATDGTVYSGTGGGSSDGISFFAASSSDVVFLRLSKSSTTFFELEIKPENDPSGGGIPATYNYGHAIATVKTASAEVPGTSKIWNKITLNTTLNIRRDGALQSPMEFPLVTQKLIPEAAAGTETARYDITGDSVILIDSRNNDTSSGSPTGDVVLGGGKKVAGVGNENSFVESDQVNNDFTAVTTQSFVSETDGIFTLSPGSYNFTLLVGLESQSFGGGATAHWQDLRAQFEICDASSFDSGTMQEPFNLTGGSRTQTLGDSVETAHWPASSTNKSLPTIVLKAPDGIVPAGEQSGISSTLSSLITPHYTNSSTDNMFLRIRLIAKEGNNRAALRLAVGSEVADTHGLPSTTSCLFMITKV